MKKFNIVLLLLFACVILVSCDIYNAHIENESKFQTSNVTETETETDAAVDMIEYPTLTITSAKEYNSLLSSNILSDKFVTYESISMFGEFGFLVFTCDTAGNMDYSRYIYNFNYQEFDLALQIYENGDSRDTSKVEITNVNVNDLRVLNINDEDIHEVYKYNANGFEYSYIGDRLLSVKWENNGVIYILTSADYALSEYDILANDVISQLLTSQYEKLDEIAIFKDAVEEK